jgi:hypothetical protein
MVRIFAEIRERGEEDYDDVLKHTIGTHLCTEKEKEDKFYSFITDENPSTATKRTKSYLKKNDVLCLDDLDDKG